MDTHSTSTLAYPATWKTRHARSVPWCVTLLIILFTLLEAASAQVSLFAAVGLFIAGVPHGSTERLQDGSHRIPRLDFTVLYLVFGGVILGSWLISPIGTLVLFLALSAWHFGLGEPSNSKITNLLIGAWVVTGSLFLYPAETLRIFEFITARPDLLLPFTGPTQVLAALMFIAMCTVTIRQISIRPLDRTQIFRLLSLIAIFILLPPVPAVAVYFFAIHSLGEMAEALDHQNEKNGLLGLARLYTPASLPALLGGTGMVVLTAMGIVPLSIAAGLGVAFTVPHMLIVERLTQAAHEHPAPAAKPQ